MALMDKFHLSGRICGGFTEPVVELTPVVAVGNSGNETLTGGEGRDRLDGRGGDDLILGLAGSDRLAGGAGADLLDGGSGHDRLAGGAGRDTLAGGVGADALDGGTGHDRLTGGLGRDLLTGGDGADRFIFTDLRDSTVARADTVTDFATGSDRIDLRQIDADSTLRGNQAFTFIGTEAFGQHAGELRYAVSVVDSVSHLRIEADVDGDGSADLAILLLACSAVDAGDFLL